MFNEIYTYQGTIARHVAGPLMEQRRRYLVHCAEQGAKPGTLKGTAHMLLAVAERMKLQKQGAVSLKEIRAAANRWAGRQPQHYAVKHARKSRAHFISVAAHWLRFLGRLRVPASPPIPCADLLADFMDHMRRERGLSPATLQTQCWYVTDFLRRFCSKDHDLRKISARQLDQALARKSGEHGYSRRSLRCVAEALRSFFRHAEFRGWCSPGLAAAIRSPRVYQDEGLPSGPAWNDVQRLLADTEGSDPTNIRDRAILLLLAVYGLRSAEVRALRLEDLDWHKELIRVRRAKRQRTEECPLIQIAGEAIIRYLKEVRPCSSYRELFLTLQAPVQPLTRSGLWHTVGRRLRKLKIPMKHHGPHSLRHACATHLLAQGSSLKEIGDHLGHRSPKATRIYAKVDLSGLREVADFDLGGLA